MTLANAAAIVASTPEALTTDLEAGRLKGFKVGGEWRTTEEDLLEFMGRPVPVAGEEPAAVHEPVPTVPAEVTWQPVEPFSFTWPVRSGDDPANSTEQHGSAYQANISFQGRNTPIRIGFTDRRAAGMNRKRVNVFLVSGTSLVPLVQFVGANDFDVTGRLASVIKRDNGRHLRPGDEVPEEYRDLPRCVYSEVVVGPNAARSVAVLAHRDELTLMARHGLIRARWKELS